MAMTAEQKKELGQAMVLVAFLAFCLVAALTLWRGSEPFLEGRLQAMLGRGPAAPLIFILLFVAATMLLAPSLPFVLAAGALFDPLAALLYVTVASMGSASASFGIARRVGTRFVARVLPAHFPRIHDLNVRLRDGSASAVFLLRLLLPIPFGVFNYSFGLSQVRFSRFAVGTLLGTTPWTVVYLLFGRAAVTADLRLLVLALAAGAAWYLWTRAIRTRAG